MHIFNKISEDHVNILNNISVPLVYKNSSNQDFYIADPIRTSGESFDYVYSPFLTTEPTIRDVNIDLMCAFICYRLFRNWDESNIKIFDTVKTVKQWHYYFIKTDVGAYVNNLKKFKYYRERRSDFMQTFPKRLHFLFKD